MITFKGSKISIPKIEKGLYSQAFVNAMATQLRAAAAEWVKEVLKHIPVYTGAARGTFAPLSRALSRFGVRNPYVGPVNNLAAEKIKKGAYIRGTRYDVGYYGAQQYGQYFFEIPKGNRSITGLTFTFGFSNNLPYMLWNDIYPAPYWMIMPSNPPWDYINKGNDAFVHYALFEIPKHIPSLTGFLSYQIVSVR